MHHDKALYKFTLLYFTYSFTNVRCVKPSVKLKQLMLVVLSVDAFFHKV